MAPKKAAPKRTTRLNPGATSNPNQAPSTTTTIVTNAQLQAMINQGVNVALAARDANRTGNDNHTSRTGVKRTERDGDGFHISNCLAENQVKFAICTLLAELKKKMADKYCPRNEIKKIETEFWNLEVQGTDVTRYNQRFQELALLCVRTFPKESDRVERYIGGLLDSIHGSVAASKPKNMQEATEMAMGLMDKKIRTYAERQAANKRKFEDTSRNNQGRHRPPKRQDVAMAYAAGSGKNLDANTVTGTFLLNNCYASVLFNTDADRSFISTAFSSQFDIAPTVLDHDYAIELADGRIVGVNTAVIVCADKIVRIPRGRETLIFHGDEAEGKSEKKRLENVPIVRDFPKVFPEDFLGPLPTRQVVFQIDLIPGAAPVNKKEHEEHLRTIMKLLKKEELYAKFSKCEFWIPK
nr:hypothetical protein [Tanacetum cinerariifolium]